MDKSLHYSKISPEQSIKQLQGHITLGLSSDEASKRLLSNGPNSLTIRKSLSKWIILGRQLKSIIILLLGVACLISFIMGQFIEGLSVVAVIIINTSIGFFTELRAIRSMEALKKMGLTQAVVIRDGIPQKIPAQNLVPGDITLLEAGDIIAADMRLLESSKLSVDESILTGESVPVDKFSDPLTHDLVMAERHNILFRGTSLTRGSAKAIIFATGMETEVGKIAQSTQNASSDLTPLEKRLDHLGHQLVWVSLIIAAFVGIAGVISGKDLLLMLETATALAVATIPEGLPIVATMALAKGMWRMANKNALINKLAAVETLGATSHIFSDKTGTLTENKMAVRAYQLFDGYKELTQTIESVSPTMKKALQIGVLCNNSSIKTSSKENYVGDPMEIALLEAGNKYGMNKEQLLETLPEKKEVTFDSSTLMMATFHQQQNAKYFVAVKGAPENVLDVCTFIFDGTNTLPFSNEEKDKWRQKNEDLANEGLRILAVAFKEASSLDDVPYENLVFVGHVGLLDPARKGIKQAIDQCLKAGISTIMLTGDQEGTAKKIALDIGLINNIDSPVIHGKNLPPRNEWNQGLEQQIAKCRIYCRMSPKQKLDLISYYQDKGHVVSMTGDGVNDAPALKKADIGIAMGLRGTQVAKEASDMILQDDRFETIIMAIKQGRVIYSNIQRFMLYLLSCNISEILIVSIAAMVNAPLPLLPLQILFLNLVTDVFPALALGMGEGDDTYLTITPRKKGDQILTSHKWFLIGVYGLILTTSILMAFFYTLRVYSNPKIALTVSFLSLGFAQIVHVFNMRLEHAGFFKNDVTKNPHVWAAVFICIGLLAAAISVPQFRQLLELTVLNWNQWIIIIIASLAPLVVIQLLSKLHLGIRS